MLKRVFTVPMYMKMQRLPDEILAKIATYLAKKQKYHLNETHNIFTNDYYDRRKMRFEICLQNIHCPKIKAGKCAVSACCLKKSACYQLEPLHITYVSNYCGIHHPLYNNTRVIDLI